MSEGIESRQGKVVVLIDYENIVHEATDLGMVVDFEGLAELRREYGDVIFGMIFAPERYIQQDPWLREKAWDYGFFTQPIFTQTPGREKYYRTADAMMDDFGRRFCSLSDVKRIVIVSHDGDFTPLANHARDAGKEVFVVAGKNVSQALIKAVDFLHNLPMTKN